MKKMIAVLTLFSAMSVAGAVQISYTLDAPTWQDQRGKSTFTFADDMVYAGEPGAPAIPEYPIRILLPPDEELVSIQVSYGGLHRWEKPVTLPVVQQPYPFSKADEASITEMDPAIWSSNEMLPAGDYSHLTSSHLAGHTIVMANLHPVRYQPATETFSWYEQMDVTVNTRPAPAGLRVSEKSRNRVERLVDNPQMLDQYEYPTLRTDDYDYLIVTGSSLVSYFQPLADFKNSLGLKTEIHTIEDVYANYTGVDNADRLRNFLIDEYNNHDIQYLLLGGDTDVLPWRGLYVSAGGETDQLPSDLYFAGLDGTWNSDGDSNYGEVGEQDWFAELYVGRAGVSSSTQATNFVAKQIGYQQSPVTGDLANYLMIGEQLDDNPTWGGDCKDEIINGASTNGMVTTGLPANVTATTLYDRNSTWSATQLFNLLGQGINVTNHLGHSNATYIMKFYNSSVTNSNLTSNGSNHNFHIGYSQGCIPGAFDENDCILENLTNLENGYAAFIGNSRYGWYSPGSTSGPSQMFDRQFFDAVFGEGITAIGAANHDSKEDLASSANADTYLRWCYYELNLFGDPTLNIWSDAPLNVTITADNAVTVGTSSLDVQVDAGANPAAGRLVALVQGTDVFARAILNSSGMATLNFDPALTVPGTYQIVVSGYNILPTSRNLEVIAPSGPYLIQDHVTVLDGANGLADAGETFDLELALNNVGTETAHNVSAVVSSTDPLVNIIVNTASFADIVADGIGSSLTNYEMQIDPGCPDGTQITFDVNAVSNEGNWGSTFHLSVQAPQPAVSEQVVLDGDNNQLDPGETAQFRITLANEGSGDMTGISASLSTTDPLLTVTDGSDNLSLLPGNGSGILTFELAADPSAPIGHTAGLVLQLNGDLQQNATLNTALTIGISMEDFETGDFSLYPWVGSWTIDTTPHTGSYSAKSGTITHNQATALELTQYVVAAGDISFYYRVSSESNYDYLRFYIDSNEMASWSGEVAWTEGSYAVAAGEHTFRWVYEKDGSVNSGSDCAWVDDIVFPPLGPTPAPELSFDPAMFAVTVPNGASTQRDLNIQNSGDADLTWSLSFQEATRSYSDDMESGESGWTHTGTNDNWALTEHRSASASHSWYNGVEGSWQYMNSMHSWLTSPSVYVEPNAVLTFNHWIDMEINSDDPTHAWDGGLVELSDDNGASWNTITPAGGYPYLVQDNPDSPFAAETPVFSGSHSWQPETFDLSAWEGESIRIRFRFGSDGYVTAEGWYIDDVSIAGDQVDWIYWTPGSGTVPAGDETIVTITFDGTNYANTVLSGTLILSTNDSDEGISNIPVTLQVGGDGVIDDLSVSLNDAQVQLDWSAIAGAASYQVYESEVPYSGFELIGSTSSNSFTYTPVSGANHFYRVTIIW